MVGQVTEGGQFCLTQDGGCTEHCCSNSRQIFLQNLNEYFNTNLSLNLLLQWTTFIQNTFLFVKIVIFKTIYKEYSRTFCKNTLFKVICLGVRGDDSIGSRTPVDTKKVVMIWQYNLEK